MAVLIHPVGEVLAGDAAAATLLSLQLPLVDRTPAPTLTLYSSSVLILLVLRGQGGESHDHFMPYLIRTQSASAGVDQAGLGWKI